MERAVSNPEDRDTVRELGKPKDTLRGLNEGAPGADEPPPSSGARSVVIVPGPASEKTAHLGSPAKANAPQPAAAPKKNSVPRLLAGNVTQPPTWLARKAEAPQADASEADDVQPDDATEPDEPVPALPVRSSRRGAIIVAALVAAVVVGWFVMRSRKAPEIERAPNAVTTPAATPLALTTSHTQSSQTGSAASAPAPGTETPQPASTIATATPTPTAPIPPAPRTSVPGAGSAKAPASPATVPPAAKSSQAPDPNQLLFPPGTN